MRNKALLDFTTTVEEARTLGDVMGLHAGGGQVEGTADE